MTFETSRLLARPLEVSDQGAFHRIWGDPRVIWWGAMPDAAASARKLDEILERVRNMPAGQGWFAVVEKASGVIIGDVVLAPYITASDLELGWHFAFDSWGQGYATEASRGLVRYAFERVNAHRLVADIVPGNLLSMRLAARLGMHRIGDRVRATLPHVVLALDRGEAEAAPWWPDALVSP
ncbi:GNAT family N-acetyltransferase [Polyangium jinanense]|uniref:GNAT family N-acetyltransferase n=1 Tax=Polyangium jinanense TaxID=2829994 RepID=A0A9X3X775_9BACT|nr:GNAT family N-acetyltransferase [Polyangium jinanense]MDC3957319.1 GNAT family N-acetyltransferase [Polyangium jinanense]MDC3982721.1 GNAT family N-acetyltransferase [Polyangium jinanense]